MFVVFADQALVHEIFMNQKFSGTSIGAKLGQLFEIHGAAIKLAITLKLIGADVNAIQ